MYLGQNQQAHFLSIRTPRATPLPRLLQVVRICLIVFAVLFCSTEAVRAQSGYTFSPAVTVGATPQVQTIPVAIKNPGILGSIQVLTLGTPNLDFTLSQPCVTGIPYTTLLPCIVSVQFAPAFPGARQGAIVLLDTSGNVMATELLTGIGTGPLSVMAVGQITTLAGTGHLVDNGDGTGGSSAGLATSAAIHEPLGVATDGAGKIYYTDSGSNSIRRVDPLTNQLTTVAGTGSVGFSPDGTPATSALLSTPATLLIDGAGNLIFSDTGNNVIREIVAATGKILTLAGSGVAGYTGDNGPATAARLYGPQGIGLDPAGNLYIADTSNNVIRKVDVSTGIITTIAGNGTAGNSGDNGPATSAKLNSPWGVTYGPDGNLYIADFANNLIRVVSNGTIVSIIGAQRTNPGSYAGDNGPAVNATIYRPTAIVFNAAGDMYICDSENNVVRKVTATSQIITTVAGTGFPGYVTDGFDATAYNLSELNKPYAISLDGAGDLFIADRLGLRIREVNARIGYLVYDDIKVTNTAPSQPQNFENDGNAPLHITSVTPISNAVIDAGSTTCTAGLTMPVGSACTVGAAFRPMVVGTPVVGSIDVVSDSANTPVSVVLRGNSLSIFPTTVLVSATPNPAGLGSAVTLSAVVSSAATSPITGSVSFYDNGVLLGGAAQLLNSQNTANFTTASLALGSHPITALYSGDKDNATSTSTPAFIEVIKQLATVALAGTPNPSKVYDSVSFTATVTPTNSGGTTPTGNISFASDGNLLPNGTVALTAGVATYSTSLIAQGQHTITATYSGDANNLPPSSPGSLTQTVNLATTTTTLSTSNATVTPTNPVTFTATVAGIPASIPTGNVVFKDGVAVIGTVAVGTANGVATFTTSSLPAGSHTITATYQGDTDYAASTSPTVVETIQQIATSGILTTSTSPIISGAPVRFVVNLTAAVSTSPNQPITGTVTLTDGANVLGSAALVASGTGPATATVSISSSNFTPGAHAIIASYAGDTNYLASTATETVQVGSASTSAILVGSAPTVIATKDVTFTTTVTGNGATPGGTVTFADGPNVLGSVHLNNSGAASITLNTLAVGTHAITASYSGDTNDSPSTSNTITVTVQSAVTSVALSPSQNPSSFGQSLGLTAMVTGNGATPTGSVTFSDNGAPLATVPLTNGSATLSSSSLTVGAHVITAAYSGDGIDESSVSGPITEHILQTIAINLTSGSPNPSVARSSIRLIAIITALQGIAPTGTITFREGTAILGIAAISNATAALDIATLSVGTHQIVASYAGDGTSQPLDSAPYSQVVNAAGTSITISSSANPATAGAPLVLTATASSPAGALSGTVIFRDGTTDLGQGTLSNGVATLSTTALQPGSHSIVAAYQGDANDAPASSSVLIQTVERSTTVVLSSSQNPLLTLSPVVITATVANGGTTPATGTITFTQDNAVIGTAQLSAGIATLSLTSLPVGDHTFSASYAGDSLDFPSTSPNFNQTIQLRTTTNALSTSASSLTGGQQLTLSSIIRWTGPVTPSGKVTFFNNSVAFGSATVDAQGVATFTVLFSGTSANLTADYSGDSSYSPSNSPVTTVPIGSAPNINMTVTPATLTLQSGQHTGVTVSIASVKNFTDTFQLGCLGLPYAATCTFGKDTVNVPSGATPTTTLVIDTGTPLLGGTQAGGTQARNESPARNAAILACFLPGSLLLLLFAGPRSRLRSMRALLAVLCMAGIAAGLSGCGGIQMNSTPAGSYTFQVTAVGQSGVTQFVTVSMTVGK